MIDIPSQYTHVTRGTTYSGICPVCDGGKTHEQSFSVSRNLDGYFAWKCHRASCGYRGQEAAFGGATYERAAAREYLPYAEELRLPTLNDEWGFKLGFQTGEPEVERFAARRGYRVVTRHPEILAVELRALSGELRGYQLRTLDKRIRTIRQADGPLYYTGIASSRTAWLVEDPLSAAMLAEAGAIAIALLGTNLPDELLREIDEHPLIEHLVVCLDPDAASASMANANKARGLGFNVVPYLGYADPKNLTATELGNLVRVFS